MRNCNQCDKLYQVLSTKMGRVYSGKFCTEKCRQDSVNDLMNKKILPPAVDMNKHLSNVN